MAGSKKENRGVNFDAISNPHSPEKQGKSWFVGIGIDHYLHFSRLNNAVKDVKNVFQLLQEQYSLESGYTDTLFNEEATRENIILHLDELVHRVAPDDKLLIYYSGHGHLDEKTGRGYWIPYDAEKRNTAQYIRNSTLKEYLEDINAFHTLLISDACFSGSLFYRGETRSSSPAIPELESRKSRWALCSGRHDEEVHDGEPGTNSPFAASILYVLRENQMPTLRVSRLADEVIDLTRANYRQTPEGNPMFGMGHKGGQYVFRKQNDLAQTKGEAHEGEELTAPPTDVPRVGASRPGIKWILGSVLFLVLIVVGLVYWQKFSYDPPVPLIEGAEKLGGQTYRTITFSDDITWMAENLNFDVGEGSWCFDGGPKNCSKYGRLYTLKAAKKACAAIGWELPSDRQWRTMAGFFGGVDDESGDRGQEAFRKLSKGGESGFEVQFSGRRDSNGDFINLGRYGFYWSSTEHSPLSYYYFTFNKEREELNRWYMNDHDLVGYSCRCVKK